MAVLQNVIGAGAAGLTLLFQSFAYKHGVPLDTDMVFDVRCLPNPYYDPRLRPYTGRDAPVRDNARRPRNQAAVTSVLAKKLVAAAVQEGVRTVVIGGGVIGTSVAYHLAHLGEDVLLVERGQHRERGRRHRDRRRVSQARRPGPRAVRGGRGLLRRDVRRVAG